MTTEPVLCPSCGRAMPMVWYTNWFGTRVCPNRFQDWHERTRPVLQVIKGGANG